MNKIVESPLIRDEKIKNTRKRLLTTKRIMMLVSLSLMIVMMLTNVAFAADTNKGVTEFNNIIKFIATWIGRLGFVVAFIGAVQMGFAFKNDDADGKTKGLRTIVSGFIVYGITFSLDLFGITG